MNTLRADISPKALIDYVFLNIPLHSTKSYDADGNDAFGNTRECYFYIPTWDEQDNPVDAGEEAYIAAANRYLKELDRSERIQRCSVDGDMVYIDVHGKSINVNLNRIENSANPDIVLQDVPF